MTLPEVSTFGKRVLEDGSIIYQSGQPFLDKFDYLIPTPNPGKFMLWIKNENGGDFVLDPMYFDTPELALEHFELLQESQTTGN